jgi:hypothetical protein
MPQTKELTFLQQIADNLSTLKATLGPVITLQQSQYCGLSRLDICLKIHSARINNPHDH